MKEKSPVQNVVWKGVVEFQGSPKEFEDFSQSLVKAGVHVTFDKDSVFVDLSKAGYIAPVYMDAVGVEKRLDESNSMRMKRPVLEGINGGIRTPHLHLGDEVVLVDREHFRSLLGEVAREVFEQRVASKADFTEIVAPLAAAER